MAGSCDSTCRARPSIAIYLGLVDAVRDAIQSLETDPSSVDLRKLSGVQDVWRVRVGNWRILLLLEQGVMFVVRVLDRKDAYRKP